MNIEQLIVSARAAGASDVHLVCGLPVKFRVDGRLVDAGANGDAPVSYTHLDVYKRQIYDRAFRSFSFNTGASMKTSTKTITYAFGGKTATYSFNLNFARAVAHENGEVRAATAVDLSLIHI